MPTIFLTVIPRNLGYKNMLFNRCLFLLCLISLQHALGGQLTTRCLDGESNDLFPVTSDIPEQGFEVNASVPELVSDKAGNTTNIKWVENTGGVKTTTTKIGEYDDHEIYEVVYAATKDILDENPEAPFSFVAFFYGTIQKTVTNLRPFFILSGDEARWFEYYFSATKKEPFCLMIQNTEPGNGVYTTEWDFTFSEQQALITHRSEGGRHVPTKDFDYSKMGKIIKVTTTDDN